MQSLTRRLIASLKDATGANLIEAAIITPLILLVTFAIIDFGAIFYIWLALQNGVGQASRFGVTGNTMPSMSREASVKQALIDATPTLTIPAAIIAEAILSFLGLGVQPPTPSWGTMLNTAQQFLETAPWMAWWPGLAIFTLTLSFNLAGDGLRDLLDPKDY